MALDNAQFIGGVDDAVELSEFKVRLYGPNAPPGELDFTEVGPLGQFEIPKIVREYGAEPRKRKRLSSKINFEPVKFVAPLSLENKDLRRLINQSRPRRGFPGTPLYDAVITFLDRDGTERFGIKLIEGIIYSTPGMQMNAKSADAVANIEFMLDPFDWEYTDLPE